ncbi:MAG: DUF2786 domain-containing protein [Deltaproteobacteria bacterium]|jgi:hypothetical protein|nr:DUF2786 domain-containing protein [Deltaproteobacteria bacterium]
MIDIDLTSRNDYKNLIISKLTMNYKRLISYLRFPTSDLRPALLDIRPSETYWGKWIPEENLIVINEKLIFKGTWDAVLGILGHELAHQLVSYKYPEAYLREPSHGPTFQKICKELELDPYYTTASVDLLHGEGTPPTPFGKRRKEALEHPVLIKVKKLLALASSAESFEAAAALSAVERLLMKHNLELPLDFETESPFERWQIFIGKRVTARDSLIAGILIEFFFVESIFGWHYDIKELENRMHLDIIGKPMNLAMAEYVWYFMVERCQALWEAYKPQAKLMGEKGIRAKNIFTVNLLNAFRAKMRQEKDQGAQYTTTGETALVEANERELKKFLKLHYPYLKKTSNKISSNLTSPFCASAGTTEGRALTIHTPVGNSKSSGVQGRIGGKK